ncbi:Protein flp [Paraglaciecola mesophila]|uniref:Protein flp n=1 Tax=Paraglaciecola mesophila TaxID=197222 RepID=A0A857JNE4_9ALTE|nr:serine hydrolase [Paraglaciecola mesophila]QHJ12630.1 Protein flp [Paraglaciecola mesophila]
MTLHRCIKMNYIISLLCLWVTMWATTLGAKVKPVEQNKPLESMLDMAQVDTKIHKIMDRLSIPGVAVGVIKDGRIVLEKSYGVKDIRTNEPLSNQSLFKIASNTKAFTAAALGMLVDDGKLNWDDPVVKHLPDFQLHDPWISAHFTITDLLTHRSGLGLGAGDLMLWPEPSSFSRTEVVHNLRYLKPTGQFRADYAYDNLLYIVAGEVVAAASGQPWEQFVEKRIFAPLGMQHCYAGHIPAKAQPFVATPHGMVDGELATIERDVDTSKPNVSGAAGGIQCSLEDMLTWAQVQLNKGMTADLKPLFSTKQHQEMWTAKTIMPVSGTDKRYNNSHFSAYGLGWRLNDVDGKLRVHHSGSLAGMYSYVTFFPELDLGIVVLTNQQSSAARSALMYTLMKPYLGDDDTDWLNVFAPTISPAESNKAQSPTTLSDVTTNPALTRSVQGGAVTDTSLKAALGVYRDDWLGDFHLEQKNGRIQLRSTRVIKLVGELYADEQLDRFLVRWDDRSLEADVYIKLHRTKNKAITGIELIPVHADIDFSYDFQDLNLRKVNM